jgi:hypothetical protein
MVEGQASELYTSEMNTWSTTSVVQGLAEELPVDNHSPSRSILARTYPELC